jgi:hypothetical protein
VYGDDSATAAEPEESPGVEEEVLHPLRKSAAPRAASGKKVFWRAVTTIPIEVGGRTFTAFFYL